MKTRIKYKEWPDNCKSVRTLVTVIRGMALKIFLQIKYPMLLKLFPLLLLIDQSQLISGNEQDSIKNLVEGKSRFSLFNYLQGTQKVWIAVDLLLKIITRIKRKTTFLEAWILPSPIHILSIYLYNFYFILSLTYDFYNVKFTIENDPDFLHILSEKESTENLEGSRGKSESVFKLPGRSASTWWERAIKMIIMVKFFYRTCEEICVNFERSMESY